MKGIDLALLVQLTERTAYEYAAEEMTGHTPDEITKRAADLLQRDWFVRMVRSSIEVYRYWAASQEQPTAETPMSLTDLERMQPGAAVLDAVRAAGLDRPGVHLAWVVPEDVLRGLTRAYGLHIVRTSEVRQPCLAIQWEQRALFTQSDEGKKDEKGS